MFRFLAVIVTLGIVLTFVPSSSAQAPSPCAQLWPTGEPLLIDDVNQSGDTEVWVNFLVSGQAVPSWYLRCDSVLDPNNYVSGGNDYYFESPGGSEWVLNIPFDASCWAAIFDYQENVTSVELCSVGLVTEEPPTAITISSTSAGGLLLGFSIKAFIALVVSLIVLSGGVFLGMRVLRTED